MTAPARILVNASTCKRGGSLQMATMFLRQALRDPQEFEWRFAVSAEVYAELARLESSLPAMEVFERSPARAVAGRRRMRLLERQLTPDLVFTVGGPAYVEFEARHVLVCAEPWVTHAGLTAYRSQRFPDEWLRVLLRTRYRSRWFKRADYWIVQTETARQGFIRRLRVPADRCRAIPATCDPQYRNEEPRDSFPTAGETLRLLCFTAFYKHKNLGVIPEIARRLQTRLPGRRFQFVLTLPRDGHAWQSLARRAERLGVSDYVLNHEPVPIRGGPALYRTCHISFLPSVLEMFTANYPEAMAMGLPIVTSNLDFARDVCQNAALYFDPRDPDDAASQIVKLAQDPVLWRGLVDDGRRRLGELPTAEEQYRLDLDVFRAALRNTRFDC
jgi:glycosyltransferase involved in cell wall biosynthesis